MTNKLPDVSGDFDWVSERAECAPFKVFERLRAQAKNDMDKRNALTEERGSDNRTFFLESGDGWFSVAFKTLEKYSGITFNLTANGIEVLDTATHSLLHDGILTISNDGCCRLRVGNTELSLWQFRKLALQDFFFVVGR